MDEKVKKKKSKIEESSLEPNKRKQKHKERKKKHGTDKTLNPNEVVNSNIADDKVAEILDDNQRSKMKKTKNCNDSLTGMQEVGASKPSIKSKMTRGNYFKNNEGDPPSDRISIGNANAHSLVNEVDVQGKKMEKKKLSKKSKRMVEGYKSNDVDHSVVTEEGQGKEVEKVLSKCKAKNEFESNEGDQQLARGNEGEDDDRGKKMKKRKLSDRSRRKEGNEVDNQGKEMNTKKEKKANTGESPNLAPSGTSKPKRVTFSDQVEVCCDGLIRGKRFSPEEDKKVKEAVLDYIESHGLGDDGLDMVLHCRSHPEVKHCWKEIGAALPNRPYYSVYYRAHILFERDEKRKWTTEELDFIRKVQEQHGSDWKSIAEALGKNRFHVKDAWRRIKYTNIKSGAWSQEEYQQLFDLVNLDLRARALEDYRKSKHGMLRDNISWEAISNKLETRSSSRCCKKWYEQLTSPMVAQGVWSDTDDYGLLNALFVLDACCMEEVDWDNLLEHRSGDACRKRWNQMVQHIGEHGRKSFAEQVEVLSKRFCPDLLEAREAFDSKPVVC